MPKIVFPQKAAGETYKAVFEFASYMGATDTISSAATTTCSVYMGTDAAPSSVISGSATASGTKVTQLLTGGTAGVTYIITSTVTLSTNQIVSLTGFLSVVPITL